MREKLLQRRPLFVGMAEWEMRDDVMCLALQPPVQMAARELPRPRRSALRVW